MLPREQYFNTLNHPYDFAFKVNKTEEAVL